MSKEKPAGEVVSFPTPEGVNTEVKSEETSAPTSKETSKEEEIPFVPKVITEEDANLVIEAIKANVGKNFLDFSLEVEKVISAICPINHEVRNIAASLHIDESKNIQGELEKWFEKNYPGEDSATHSQFIDAYENIMTKRELSFFFRKAFVESRRNPMESLLEALIG